MQNAKKIFQRPDRNPTRRPRVIETLRKVWKQHHDHSLASLVVKMAGNDERTDDESVWDLEDDANPALSRDDELTPAANALLAVPGPSILPSALRREQIDRVMDGLAALWAERNEQRFGQLLCNLSCSAAILEGISSLTDEQLESICKQQERQR